MTISSLAARRLASVVMTASSSRALCTPCVVPSVAPSALTQSWGKLNPAKTPLAEVAAHRDEAAALVDELKFNQGAQN